MSSSHPDRTYLLAKLHVLGGKVKLSTLKDFYFPTNKIQAKQAIIKYKLYKHQLMKYTQKVQSGIPSLDPNFNLRTMRFEKYTF